MRGDLMFIDTHCHLYDEYYSDMDKVIQNAVKNNVKRVIVNGSDMKSNKEVLELIKKYDIVYGALGFHPRELDGISDEELKWLDDNLDNSKIIAVGEIGLDYHYDETDREKQQYFFRKQLEIAKKHNLPVIVHSRDSIQDTYNILKDSSVKGVLHCYSGSLEMAREFIKIGYFLGVGGIITFKNAKNIINVINNIGLEYILLETDSPYLAPEPYRGRTNEPAYIPIIASKIAALKGVSISEVERITTGTARGIFDFLK